MPFCPKCGTLVAEGSIICDNCGHSLEVQRPLVSTLPQSIQSSSNLTSSSIASKKSEELSKRLEIALRRIELLSYAIICLSVIIFIETLYWFGIFS